MHAVLVKARQGDPDSFAELIKPYERLIYNLAWHYAHNREDAKDITQDTYIKAYKNLGQCKSADSFKAWLTRIVITTSLDYLRARKRNAEDSLDEREEAGIFFAAASHDQDPEAKVLANETSDAVRRAVSLLPAEQRTLVILRDLQGFSYEEISKTMNLPLGTVKSRLSRARLKLRELLLGHSRLNVEGRNSHA
ncbi:MAG: sigma-70 family RNA polymerase sigma factor [Clostridiales bacterium]|jgi:RNA polymerase sigma-70 factor (ECF subfamily)|nr:sigma-70 family RNA polymerase sigma factor [Clostridiales bacterium]